jgi:hypothetical protein
MAAAPMIARQHFSLLTRKGLLRTYPDTRADTLDGPLQRIREPARIRLKRVSARTFQDQTGKGWSNVSRIRARIRQDTSRPNVSAGVGLLIDPPADVGRR